MLLITGALKPGESVGTTNPRMPSSVCAHTTATSATAPLVIHILVPLSTQSAPSRLAEVRMPDGVGAEVGLGQPEAADLLARWPFPGAIPASAPRCPTSRWRTSPTIPARSPVSGCRSRRPRARGRPARTPRALVPEHPYPSDACPAPPVRRARGRAHGRGWCLTRTTRRCGVASGQRRRCERCRESLSPRHRGGCRWRSGREGEPACGLQGDPRAGLGLDPIYHRAAGGPTAPTTTRRSRRASAPSRGCPSARTSPWEVSTRHRPPARPMNRRRR